MRSGTWVARSSVDWSLYRLNGPGDKEPRLSPTRHWGIDLGETMASSGGEDGERAQNSNRNSAKNTNIVASTTATTTSTTSTTTIPTATEQSASTMSLDGGLSTEEGRGSMEKVRGEKAFQPIQVT
eukprot:508549-Rhodomonas_salina.1